MRGLAEEDEIPTDELSKLMAHPAVRELHPLGLLSDLFRIVS